MRDWKTDTSICDNASSTDLAKMDPDARKEMTNDAIGQPSDMTAWSAPRPQPYPLYGCQTHCIVRES